MSGHESGCGVRGAPVSPKLPQAERMALYLELKGVWDDVPLPPGPTEELGMICRFQDREMEAVLAK